MSSSYSSNTNTRSLKVSTIFSCYDYVSLNTCANRQTDGPDAWMDRWMNEASV